MTLWEGQDFTVEEGIDALSKAALTPIDPTQQRRYVTNLGAERIERFIPGVGLLVFENADVGQWLTKKGEPAKKAKRTYTLTRVGDGNPQTELDAVSSIVGCLDKYALRGWYEDHGARGAVKAYKAGELKDVPEAEIIYRVRELGLGAKNALSDASARGTAVHNVLEKRALGKPAMARDLFPLDWLAWYDGAQKAWEQLAPEPVEVEQIVCHPDDCYAGRPDIVARIGETPTTIMRGWAGKLALLDYKTGKGRIFREAHFQTRLYERARRACGLEPCDLILIVGVTDQGDCLFNEGVVGDGQAEDLLRTYRTLSVVDKAIAEVRKAA